MTCYYNEKAFNVHKSKALIWSIRSNDINLYGFHGIICLLKYKHTHLRK